MSRFVENRTLPPTLSLPSVVGEAVEKVRKNNCRKYLKVARLHRVRAFFGG
jgi:hypothetical protein